MGTTGGQRSMQAFPSSLSTMLMTESQNLELTHTFRLAGQDLTVSTSPALRLQEHMAAPALCMWMPRTEAMSSSLRGKHITDYAISLTHISTVDRFSTWYLFMMWENVSFFQKKSWG